MLAANHAAATISSLFCGCTVDDNGSGVGGGGVSVVIVCVVDGGGGGGAVVVVVCCCCCCFALKCFVKYCTMFLSVLK